MNISKILKKITAILKTENFSEEANYLIESESIGSTGGEIFDILLGRLIELKKNNSIAYKKIKDQANYIFEYAKEIGRL